MQVPVVSLRPPNHGAPLHNAGCFGEVDGMKHDKVMPLWSCLSDTGGHLSGRREVEHRPWPATLLANRYLLQRKKLARGAGRSTRLREVSCVSVPKSVVWLD